MSSRAFINPIFVSACLLLLGGCFSARPSVTVQTVTVEQARGAGDFVALAPNSTGPLSEGDRIRTLEQGEALLQLPCALVRLFGGSNLQLQQQSANGANLRTGGAALVSSKCQNIALVNDVAIVQSLGTVFFYYFDAASRQALLWTSEGKAQIYNRLPDGSRGTVMTVAAGSWSIVRPGSSPDPARPVSEMGATIDRFGLRPVYQDVVRTLQTQGFGPSAQGPLAVSTIVDRAPAPLIVTPTPIPTATATSSPTRVPVLFIAQPETVSPGDRSVLSWNAAGAQAVYLDKQPVKQQGRIAVAPATTTTYTLHVVYLDGSAQDYTATITVLDNAGPSFGRVLETIPLPLSYNPKCGGQAAFLAEVSDSSGVATVILKYLFRNDFTKGDWAFVAMLESKPASGVYNFTFDISKGAYAVLDGADGWMDYQIIATDNLGKVSTTGDSIAITAACPIP